MGAPAPQTQSTFSPWEKVGENRALPRPRQKSLPSPPGRGWLAAGAFTSRGETGEGSLPRVFHRHPHCLRHDAHELVRVLLHHGIGNAQQSYQPTRGFELQASGYRVRGSNPSSGPRRLKSAPVAVHLLPLGEGRGKSGAARPRQKSLPSPPGRGWLAAGAFTSAARRVRGHFLAFSTDTRIASTTSRTNSSGCSSTIAFGIRNNRIPSVRK